MKFSQRRRAGVELLEARILLSDSLALFDGVTLGFDASAGVDNRVLVATGPLPGQFFIEDPADTISLTAGMSPAGWTVSSDGHTASGPQGSITSVFIDTDDGDDTVEIQSTQVPIEIQPGVGGSEEVAVGGDGAPFGAQLIDAPITFDPQHAQSASLIVDDSGDTSHRDPTVTSTSIEGLAPQPITFGDAASPAIMPADASSNNTIAVQLNSGTGGNATIISQSPDDPTSADFTLNAGGNDTVVVQQLNANSEVVADETAMGATDAVVLGAAGSLAGVRGPLGMSGGQGSSTLDLEGSADAFPLNLNIVADGTEGSIGNENGTVVEFDPTSLASLTFDAGSGGNHFNVDFSTTTEFPDQFVFALDTGGGNDMTQVTATAPGTTVSLEGNAGTDQVTLDAGQIDGAVEVSNQNGSDAVAIDGSAFTAARTIAVSDSDVSGLGGNMSLANLSSLSVTGGSGADTFDVTPSASVPITVDGGSFAPLASPADTLNVTTTGGVAPVLQLQTGASGDQGSYTFSNLRSVAFSRFGVVAPALATISGLVFNGQNANPLAGAMVFLDQNDNGSLDPGESSVISNSQGMFQFTGLSAATYHVDARLAGFIEAGSPRATTISAGQTQSVSVPMVPAPAASGPDLRAVLSPAAASAIGGTTGKLKLKITNAGPGIAAASPEVTVFASSDGQADPSDTQIAAISAGSLKLKKGASRTITLSIVFPTSLTAGNYFLLASIDSSNLVPESNEANNIAASAKSVAIAPPFVDLTGTFSRLPKLLKSGKPATIPITIRNPGNVAATGTIDLDLFASPDQTLDVSDKELAAQVMVKINIGPGKSQSVSIHLPAGVLSASSDFLIADINSTRSLVESSFANNDVVSSAVVPIT